MSYIHCQKCKIIITSEIWHKKLQLHIFITLLLTFSTFLTLLKYIGQFSLKKTFPGRMFFREKQPCKQSTTRYTAFQQGCSFATMLCRNQLISCGAVSHQVKRKCWHEHKCFNNAICIQFCIHIVITTTSLREACLICFPCKKRSTQMQLAFSVFLISGYNHFSPSFQAIDK